MSSHKFTLLTVVEDVIEQNKKQRPVLVGPKGLLRNDGTVKDFFVGGVVTLASAPFLITRSDEYSLKHMEAVGAPEFPMCDLRVVMGKIAGLKDDPDFKQRESCDPETLQDLALQKLGVRLADQELITILRALGEPGASGMIPVASLVECMM